MFLFFNIIKKLKIKQHTKANTKKYGIQNSESSGTSGCFESNFKQNLNNNYYLFQTSVSRASRCQNQLLVTYKLKINFRSTLVLHVR